MANLPLLSPEFAHFAEPDSFAWGQSEKMIRVAAATLAGESRSIVASSKCW
jgi:hypothetical protein